MSRGPKSMKSVFELTATKDMDEEEMQSEIWAFCSPPVPLGCLSGLFPSVTR